MSGIFFSRVFTQGSGRFCNTSTFFIALAVARVKILKKMTKIRTQEISSKMGVQKVLQSPFREGQKVLNDERRKDEMNFPPTTDRKNVENVKRGLFHIGMRVRVPPVKLGNRRVIGMF